MSDPKPIVIKSVPRMLGNQFTIIKDHNLNRKVKVFRQIMPKSKETVIFDSMDVSFLRDTYQKVTIINTENVANNTSRTEARITNKNGDIIVKNSDQIVDLIGQTQYDILFMALCSVINQELRVRGIMSMLTLANCVEKKNRTNDVECQTNEMRIKKVIRKQKRRRPTPYVVKNFKEPAKKLRKLVIDPKMYENTCLNTTETEAQSETIQLTPSNTSAIDKQIETSKNFPSIIDTGTQNAEVTSEFSENGQNITEKSLEITELGDLPDLSNENTSDSFSFSVFSFETSSELLHRPLNLLIDNHTQPKKDELPLASNVHYFRMVKNDKSDILLPYKDVFHIATAENLAKLDAVNQMMLKKYQRSIDLKYYNTPLDEDGNLPLHMAVLQEDHNLLKRQCIIYSMLHQSVDRPANGLTALKLSLFEESTACTRTLLQHGADPLRRDEHETAAHAAAELDSDHLSVVLAYCTEKARKLMLDNEELQFPGWQEKSDEELAQHVMDRICSRPDKRGHTPLMLASVLGIYQNVRLLLERSPTSVNIQVPNSGNTALYLAIMAAYNAISESCNVNKVMDKFRMTIENLLEHGANPGIDNLYGSNVNTLLNEYNCRELSMVVGNKVTSNNFFNKGPQTKDFDKFILVKDESGEINITDLKTEKKTSHRVDKMAAKKNCHKVNSDKVIVKNKSVTVFDKSARMIIKSGESVNVNVTCQKVDSNDQSDSVKFMNVTPKSINNRTSDNTLNIIQNTTDIQKTVNKLKFVKIVPKIDKTAIVTSKQTAKKPIILRSKKKPQIVENIVIKSPTLNLSNLNLTNKLSLTGSNVKILTGNVKLPSPTVKLGVRLPNSAVKLSSAKPNMTNINLDSSNNTTKQILDSKIVIHKSNT